MRLLWDGFHNEQGLNVKTGETLTFWFFLVSYFIHNRTNEANDTIN